MRLLGGDMKITKEQIDHVFDRAEHQDEAVVSLYRLAIPDFDMIKAINGFPEAGQEVSKYIFKKFIEFDRQRHSSVMAGGAWLNWGFSTNKSLDGWEIIINPEIIKRG